MADPLGFVTMAILLGGAGIFLKQRGDWRISRSMGVVAITTLLMIAILHSDLLVATPALIIASELALLPLVISGYDELRKKQIQTIITCQICSHIFLLFSVLFIRTEGSSNLVHVLLFISVLLQLAIPFLSRTLSNGCLFLPASTRALFYLSLITFGIFVGAKTPFSMTVLLVIPFVISLANAYWSENARERFLFATQALICVPIFLCPLMPTQVFDIAASICILGTIILAQSTALMHRALEGNRVSPRWFSSSHYLDVRIYNTFDFIVRRLSLVCRRVLGPIAMEWAAIRIPAFALSIMRFLSRSISYASIPKLIATSIVITIFLIVYLIKV